MKKSLVLFFAVFAFSIVVISSCKKVDDPTPDCNVENMSFASDVMPIMNASCNVMGCHDNITAASGLRLDTFPQISTFAAEIALSINHTAGVEPMPAGADKLSDCDISKFEAWVSQGKKDN